MEPDQRVLKELIGAAPKRSGHEHAEVVVDGQIPTFERAIVDRREEEAVVRVQAQLRVLGPGDDVTRHEHGLDVAPGHTARAVEAGEQGGPEQP